MHITEHLKLLCILGFILGASLGVEGGDKVLRNVSIKDYCIRLKFTHKCII